LVAVNDSGLAAVSLSGYTARRGKKLSVPQQVMSPWLRELLESKRAMRRQLAARPIAEKLKLLEKLRDRSVAIAASPLRRQQQRKG
jgi:hypothetical protein